MVMARKFLTDNINLGCPQLVDDNWIHINVRTASGRHVVGQIRVNVRANVAKYLTIEEVLDNVQ